MHKLMIQRNKQLKRGLRTPPALYKKVLVCGSLLLDAIDQGLINSYHNKVLYANSSGMPIDFYRRKGFLVNYTRQIALIIFLLRS